MNTHFIEVHRTFKYRMYQNRKTEKRLFQTIDIAGIIWNHCVALQRRYYRLTDLGLRVTSAEAARLASLVALARASHVLGDSPQGAA